MTGTDDRLERDARFLEVTRAAGLRPMEPSPGRRLYERIRHAVLGCIATDHYLYEPGTERLVLIGRRCLRCGRDFPIQDARR